MTSEDRDLGMKALDGRVAVVTGAGGGIGREHALHLARHGAQVVVNDTSYRRSADAASVVAEIEAAGGSAVASRTSATWDGAEDIVGTALDTFGRLDILVNNATAAWGGDLWAISEEQFDLTFDVNVKGYFGLIRAAAPAMAQQGSGVIVNTSSASGFGDPGNSIYSAAKESVVGLTRTAGCELGRFGIRVNAIRPVALGRSFTAYASAVEKWHDLVEAATGVRPTEGLDADTYSPDKVAAFVTWLCTDDARHVNGRVFSVGGGAASLLADEVVEQSIQPDSAGGDSTWATVTEGLQNPWAVPDHPELRSWHG
ncbi:SDR family NAD(P)-dependent oxidoreductase [Nocardioides sp. LML1-1-1.1]|uniref:SDR family NAD(P)-dependent oxidoreductase n=1 Tax=Nocardioides sp. LML1-1-1.1 TaxID=3135248 RepID=UPI003445B345